MGFDDGIHCIFPHDRRFQCFADGLQKIVAVEVKLPGFHHDPLHLVAEELAQLVLRRGPRIGDHGADAGLDDEEPVFRQRRHDLLRGVRIDPQFLAQDADGGELVPGSQRSGDDRLFDRIYHLFVGVRPRLELDLKR